MLMIFGEMILILNYNTDDNNKRSKRITFIYLKGSTQLRVCIP